MLSSLIHAYMRSSSLVRALCAVGTLGALSGLTACSDKKAEAAPVQTVPVQRQSVVVDVEATGVIQPIGAVDVRSKASGQIVAMPVQTGSQVKSGDLLVRIDPRDPQQRYDQARAALAAARAQLAVTKAQYERNTSLSKQGVITAPELETARVAYANAQSQVVAAETQVQLAQIALEDVTITAPSAGTVISANVSPGQVIASSTNSPSGGTILLTLANLSTVYDSTLVNESDIGKVKPGQTATITVDAYPSRTFHGVVEKIEPRATVQQSVTMFPVKIRIDNMDGALMPGMNSDVSILVDNRQDVLAVPVDAVRPTRDATTAAAALGLDTNSVKSAVQSQMTGGRGAPGGGDTGRGVPVTTDGASRRGANGAANGGATPNGATPNGAPRAGGQAGQGGGGQGGNFGGPPPSAAQCDSVNKAYAAHPKQRARLDSLMQQMRSGALDFQSARETMRALYDSMGVDARVARGCRAASGQGGQGGPNGAGGFGGGAGGAGGAGGFGGRGGRGSSRGIVFVQKGQSYEPRLVQLGLSNFDVVEIVSGLREGERVALVSGAVQAQNRANLQNRIRQNAMPGMGGGPGGGGGAPRGGGGGPRGG
jgi:HlyD family secretion protein